MLLKYFRQQYCGCAIVVNAMITSVVIVVIAAIVVYVVVVLDVSAAIAKHTQIVVLIVLTFPLLL